MRLGFGKLNDAAKIPTCLRGTLDIYTPYPLEIQAGEILNIKTGLLVEIPTGYTFNIMSLPSLVVHKGLEVLSGYLSLPSDFEDELIIPIRNISNNQLNLQIGQLIAIGTLTQSETLDVEEFIPRKANKPEPRNTRRPSSAKFTFKVK